MLLVQINQNMAMKLPIPFLNNSPPPIFSSDPERGVDVLDTVPKLSLATLIELRELLWDNLSNLYRSGYNIAKNISMQQIIQPLIKLPSNVV